jgi:hypothetical protein
VDKGRFEAVDGSTYTTVQETTTMSSTLAASAIWMMDKANDASITG